MLDNFKVNEILGRIIAVSLDSQSVLSSFLGLSSGEDYEIEDHDDSEHEEVDEKAILLKH